MTDRGATGPSVPGNPLPAGNRDDEDELVLDVRGLEPPEPLVRTLAALETLPPRCTLVHVNDRVPVFLLPVLDERGFQYVLDAADPQRIELRIHRAP